MSGMTLDLANAIIGGTLNAARERNLKPLSVVILDAGGHDVALQREDGSGIMRVDVARGKAWGALGFGMGSRELNRRAQNNPQFFAALAATSDGRMIPNPGGVLIRDAAGIIGAIGVSGDTSDSDEACAIVAVQQSDLIADGG